MNFSLKRGFTLLEILIVLGLLGLLYFIFSSFGGGAKSAADYANKLQTDVRSVGTVIQRYKGNAGYSTVATALLGGSSAGVAVTADPTTQNPTTAFCDRMPTYKASCLKGFENAGFLTNNYERTVLVHVGTLPLGGADITATDAGTNVAMLGASTLPSVVSVCAKLEDSLYVGDDNFACAAQNIENSSKVLKYTTTLAN